jgi:bifunctional DNA-binding transcriptional regulator/antitoxin component of YhaV-PrlF toxin-antitoxin module
MTIARFSTKGQLVVPKELRDAYAFTPGSEVEFVPEPDGLKLRLRKPAGVRRTTLAEVSGMLAKHYKGPPLSDDDIKHRLEEAMQREWLGKQDKVS